MASLITPEQMAKAGDEASHQKAVFLWAALNRPQYPQLKWLHAIPNANSHKMVAEGVRAGVPDICLPFPVMPWYGFYCEMKIEARRNQKRGGKSEEQDEWIDYLTSVGYYVVTAYGWQEAVRAILEYLTGASHVGTFATDERILG